MALAFAFIADLLIIKDWLSVTHTRKLANHISQIGSAAGFVALGFVNCDFHKASALIVAIVSVNTTAISGYMVLLSMAFQLNYIKSPILSKRHFRYLTFSLSPTVVRNGH